MSDDLIFREVDEDLRHEQFQKLWKKYGAYIVAVAVLIVAGVAGYKGWTWYQASRAADSGARFEAALRLAEQDKEAEAINAFGEIVGSGSGGYPVLARFAAAAAKARSGDRAGAAADYEALARDAGDPVLRDLARVKAALILVDTQSYQNLEARLSGIAVEGNPWRNAAWEILGLAAYRAGDMQAAAAAFQKIAADLSASEDLRQRADMMLALVAPERGAAADAQGAAP
jgi:hypothetical protein